MANRLKNLSIERVDLVDQPASQDRATGEGAFVVLFKRAAVRKNGDEPMTFEQVFPAIDWWPVKEQIYMAVEGLSRSLCSIIPDKESERESLVAQSLKQFTDYIDGALASWLKGEAVKRFAGTKDTFVQLAKATALALCEQQTTALLERAKLSAKQFGGGAMETPEEKIAREKREKEAAEKAAADAAAAKAAPDLAKRLEAIEKESADNKARAERAEKSAADERNLRLTKAAEDTLRTFKRAPVDPVKDAPIFKKLSEGEPLTKEDGARIMEIIKACDAAIDASKLFGERGTAVDAEGSALTEFNAKADKMVKDGLAKTMGEAMEAIAKREPGLYERYERERRAAH